MISLFALLAAAACGGPVRELPPASGELIAYGGGPGGAQDACFTCHGLRGEGDGLAPRLAGLDAGYLIKQLDDFARERRRHAVMTPIARRLRDSDKQRVARYYAAMPPPSARIWPAQVLLLYHRGDRSRGIIACAECHDGSDRGSGTPDISGQPAAYVAEQLRRWKHGIRRNDPLDVMGGNARPLTDEEIEALAEYVESLR